MCVFRALLRQPSRDPIAGFWIIEQRETALGWLPHPRRFIVPAHALSLLNVLLDVARIMTQNERVETNKKNVPSQRHSFFFNVSKVAPTW